MKKLVLILTATAVLGTSIQNAKAGDREWAVAGKVLTGLAAATVIARAAEPTPCAEGHYSYSTTPHAYAPAQPQVLYEQPAPPPVILAPAPIYVAPPPVVSFRLDLGGHRHPRHFRHHYRHHRHYW